MKPRSQADIGALCVLVFVVCSAFRDVYFGGVFQSISVFLVLLIAFGMMTMRSVALILLRRHDEAVEWARRSQRQPGAAQVAWTHAHEASALAHLGRVDGAHSALARALAIQPTFSASFIDAVLPFKDPNDRDHYIDGLRKAGLPE